MVTAIVLINVERGLVNSIADKMANIDGVSEVHSVAGRYDLVAIIRVPTADEMADVVTNRMLQVDGITASETLIAFQVFSSHDLSTMFDIGFE